MAQSALTIRLDSDLKMQFDSLCEGRAAFYEMRQAAADAGIQDMPLDEINEEIRLARESK